MVVHECFYGDTTFSFPENVVRDYFFLFILFIAFA